MKTAAVILASGSGQRFETTNVAKHLTPVLEVPVIIWTLDTIIKSKLFSSIVIVVREKDLVSTKKAIENYDLGDLSFIRYAIGADDRTESFIKGFEDLKRNDLVDQKSMIALFDANRPLTPKDQLFSLFEIALKSGCSCPARPVINGVAKIDSQYIVEVPDKTKFVEFVTPEFLRIDLFDEKINCFLEGYSCFVEYALNEKCKPATIKATSLNSKLTYPEDKTFLDGLAIDNSIQKPRKLI
jgi:4-diphosphocytidyl-2-methyl-D-erithritol synthase|tara:strand:+ start:994 stop:1716 length:723 start_codon:yes stop_codon:yes gene_type:complete